jgi:hypothetical protein
MSRFFYKGMTDSLDSITENQPTTFLLRSNGEEFIIANQALICSVTLKGYLVSKSIRVATPLGKLTTDS